MKQTNDLKAFKDSYCKAINVDPEKGGFVKLPIDNYQELGFLQAAIVDAIRLIGVAHEVEPQGENLRYTMEYLTRLLDCTIISRELEGLTDLFGDA